MAICDQCEIIQGRFFGKALLPSLYLYVVREDFPEQQEQPEGCLPDPEVVCGACALRSLVANASRRSADIPVI